MINLSAKIKEGKNEKIREEGFIPAVIYGYNMDNLLVQIESSAFNKIYEKAGESTLIKLNVTDKEKAIKKAPIVLIHDTQHNPVTDEFIHIDFYQPNLKEKVEVEIPLEFFGESDLIKNEDGTLVRNYSEVEIKALPEKLIHEIKVDISVLETFDDVIKIKDLKVPEGVEISDDPEEIVALISRPEDVDHELEESLDKEVEEPEVIGQKEKEEKEEKEEKKLEEKKEK